MLDIFTLTKSIADRHGATPSQAPGTVDIRATTIAHTYHGLPIGCIPVRWLLHELQVTQAMGGLPDEQLIEIIYAMCRRFVVIHYQSQSGHPLDNILMAEFGESLEDIQLCNATEAKFYEKAYLMGIAGATLSVGVKVKQDAENGSFQSQKLYLENAGLLNTAANVVQASKTFIARTNASNGIPAPDIVAQMEAVFNENF